MSAHPRPIVGQCSLLALVFTATASLSCTNESSTRTSTASTVRTTAQTPATKYANYGAERRAVRDYIQNVDPGISEDSDRYGVFVKDVLWGLYLELRTPQIV